MQISSQTFQKLNETKDLKLTRQEVLKADTDGSGTLSPTEAQEAGISAQDLPALNKALQTTAEMSPSAILFAAPGKAKALPAQIPAVKSIDPAPTAQQRKAKEAWQTATDQIKQQARNKFPEAERRAKVVEAAHKMVQERVQWGGVNKEFQGLIACPEGPYVAFIKAGLINLDQAQHMLGTSKVAKQTQNPNDLILASLGIEPNKGIPPERLYKGPHSKPTPQAGDIAVFVEPGTTTAMHFATFTGNGWEVMSVQRNATRDLPDNDHPTILTSIEEIWSGDFGNTQVVICPFPFKDP